MIEDEKFVEEMKSSLVNKDPLENKVLFRDEFDRLLAIIERQKSEIDTMDKALAKANEEHGESIEKYERALERCKEQRESAYNQFEIGYAELEKQFDSDIQKILGGE